MKCRRALVTLLPLTLAACSTWLPAAHQSPATLQSVPLPEVAVPGTDWPGSDWWQKYGDTTLDQLVRQALQGSPDIAQAESRLALAEQSVRVAAAASGLQVAASGNVSRQRLSDNGLLPARFLGFNWYTQADLGLKASYSFDWWHKHRDATNAALSSARAAQAERAAAALALTGAVAQSYFGWQADQAQLASLDAQLQSLERRKVITQLRVQAELESNDTQQALLADTASLQQARTALAYSAQLRRITLAALLGVTDTQLPAFTARALPDVSAQVPANATLDLLSRRADISAAHWRIQAATANLSAARAEFLPDVSISALAALSSIDLGKLLEAGSATPSIGAAIHLPIFDAGLLKAQYGARAAQVDAAVAAYNDAVIEAAREVATQLNQLQQLQAQQAQREQQLTALAQLLRNAQSRQERGLTDARPVLSAEQTLEQQRAARLSLQAARIATDIQLQLALGGGYRAAESP